MFFLLSLHLFVCLTFTVQNNVCAELNTTGCFHIHLLNVLSVLTLTLCIRRERYIHECDVGA